MAPPSLSAKPRKAEVKSQVITPCIDHMISHRTMQMVHKILFPFFFPFHCAESIKGAAPKLSSWPYCSLHYKAFHGQTENHGGGAGTSSRGIPSAEETETAAV